MPLSWALIHPLFLAGGPSAIRRLVIPVVVYAFYRQASGAFTHVSKELLKTVSPLLAYFDAATTVVSKVSVVLVGALLLHVVPNVVFGRFPAASREAMFDGRAAIPVVSTQDAATTTASTVSQERTPGDLLAPAIASAKPLWLPNAVWLYMVRYSFKNNELTKAFTDQVYNSCHAEYFTSRERLMERIDR